MAGVQNPPNAGGVVVPVSVANGGTGATTAAGARTNLGLGTMATQNANNVAITGGSITGVPGISPPAYVVPTTATFPTNYATGGGTPAFAGVTGQAVAEENGVEMGNVGNGAGAVRNDFQMAAALASTTFDLVFGVSNRGLETNPSAASSGSNAGNFVALRGNTGAYTVFGANMRWGASTSVTVIARKYANISTLTNYIGYGGTALGTGGFVLPYSPKGYRLKCDGTTLTLYYTETCVLNQTGWVAYTAILLATLFPTDTTFEAGICNGSTCDNTVPRGTFCYHYAPF